MNHRRNISVLNQIDKIDELSSSVGIIPICLKVAGRLPDHLHEDVGEQMMGDIDFLSSDEKYLQCAEILENAGCKHFRPFYAYMQGSTKHFPRLIHPANPLMLRFVGTGTGFTRDHIQRAFVTIFKHVLVSQ